MTIEGKNIQSIEISNISGQIVKELKVKSKKPVLSADRLKVDLSNQPKGIYFIKVTSEKGVAVEKVVLE